MGDKERFKIAMLGHKRIPSREGGIEIVVEELASRMVKRGHAVTCYNRSGHHVSGKEYEKHDMQEYRGIKLKTILTIDKKGLATVMASTFAALKAAFDKYEPAIKRFYILGVSGLKETFKSRGGLELCSMYL